MPRRSHAVKGAWSTNALGGKGSNSGASSIASCPDTRNTKRAPALPSTAARTAGVELVNVLVRETKVRREFARFGEQRRERVGAEALELVDVGEERHAVLGCLGAAPHRRELQMRDQKRAEQIRRLLPYPAFRQIGDENAAVLHRIAEVELGRVLAEHGAQRRRGGKSRQGIPVRST